MLPVFDFTREMTLLAVAARMLTAMACGGVIGIERELKRRPAGFRTHILICVGASITVLTNLFLYQVMHLYTDVSRMGAQVITGISFIGAGTIIVTKRRRVKGLTTAAGLWAVGIIGLVCGAGYLEMALFASAMVLFAELVLSRLEYRFVRHIKDTNLYVEYESADDIQEIMTTLAGFGLEVGDREIARIQGEDGKMHCCAILAMQAGKEDLGRNVIPAVAALEGVESIVEM